ncbi:MAG: phenylalanyl-tRNA synthetase subunit beta [Methanoregulaceae archaeon PtaU1.Bin059]|nr:MAG: phenylalanyl-tRNA synthetase subunit beta [Methanoregulaceae archaeon PtaU1.Bin059]
MEFDQYVTDKFPNICVAEGEIHSVGITPSSPEIEGLKQEIAREITSRYTLENVKHDPLFRAYRDFFWSVGVDPTKTRPASEALVRRILSGGRLPAINTAVDAYNLASARSGVPIGAFDRDTIDGDLTMRFAEEGEQFIGIGMEKPILLRTNQVVLTDSEEIIAVYPYRDSDATKVTIETRNIHIVACGVPKVDRERVIEGYTLCAGYLERYCGGIASAAEIFPPR